MRLRWQTGQQPRDKLEDECGVDRRDSAIAVYICIELAADRGEQACAMLQYQGGIDAGDGAIAIGVADVHQRRCRCRGRRGRWREWGISEDDVDIAGRSSINRMREPGS